MRGAAISRQDDDDGKEKDGIAPAPGPSSSYKLLVRDFPKADPLSDGGASYRLCHRSDSKTTCISE